MKRIRNSTILKILSYILIPILVIIIMGSIIYYEYVKNSEYDINEKNYLKTSQFANEYYNVLIQKLNNIKQDKYQYIDIHYNVVKIDSPKVYYETNQTNKIQNIKYIIINNNTNEIYTNVKLEDYSNSLNEIKKKQFYWNIESGNIETNLEKINETNIKYSYGINYIEELKNNGFNLYSGFNESDISEGSYLYEQKQIYEFITNVENYEPKPIIVSSILLVIIIIYLLWSIGYENNTDEIVLSALDKIPYEILFSISMIIIAIFSSLFMLGINTYINQIIIAIAIMCYIICYSSMAILTISTIKRIKSKTFIKSFLIYKILKWIKYKFKGIYNSISENTKITKKVTISYWAFIFISLILASMSASGLGLILLIAFWIWSYYEIMQYIKQINVITKSLKNIYEGKTDIYLNEKQLKGVLKEMAKYINDISKGFSSAIQENLKSERLKTELITNVSHDIKTPLTSIINYVDLLKKENIENEKIKEYIQILDNKSQRLKKLTEDLVEASKASSGNVKLNIENINLVELLNQTIGEFKDKFEENKLKIELNSPKEDIIINADNRYMYRIIENIFSNITKYAMENSRVYIDIIKEKEKVKLNIKNISKEKLNISSDELMQRFVRGDKSRYTEGSGLGLSISKSLTELQNGEFDIKIDGDLFKIEMTWDNNI